MSAQLVISDYVVDIPEDITYNFKVGDIGNISRSKSTYTSTFNIGRTSEIIALFKGLGLAGDRSDMPYVISDVILMDDYTPLLRGSLVVVDTTPEYYRVSVISGAFDFFSEIGDTRFSDINISGLLHQKTLSVVENSLLSNSGPYRYGLAYFGGMTHFTEGGVSKINIDTLIPAVRAKYLWDLIFAAFPNFTFSGSFYSSADFDELYLTFPYGDFLSDSEPNLRLNVTKSGANPSGLIIDNMVPAYTGAINFVQVRAGGVYIDVLSAGYIRITIQRFDIRFDPPWQLEVAHLEVRVNNVVVDEVFNEQNGIIGAEIDLEVNAGDYISFTWRQNPAIPDFNLVAFEADIFKIEPRRDVYDLSIATFVKEVMWRYGLVAIVERGHIDFVKYNDIITSSKVIDWSNRYARRSTESYQLDYAQNNWLRHRYNIDGETYNDKNIQSNNRNLSTERTLMRSNFFSAERDKIRFRTRSDDWFTATQLITFESQSQEEDQPSTEYKKLVRHFWVRLAKRTMPYRLGSAATGGTADEPIPAAVTTFVDDNVSFRENTHYDAFPAITDNTRVHQIELVLTTPDLMGLDLSALYFFEQEQSKYVLNSVRYTKGSLAIGEFIKIN